MQQSKKIYPSDLLTTATAARLCNRTPATIRLWATSGRLPAIVLDGGQRLFKRRDVERIAAEINAREQVA